jgi:ABC-type transporter Mla maintaining outer membrane lipid asymmetry ATPase subunit MlaF
MQPADGMPSRDIHTRFMILRDGKVIFEGTAQELGKVEDAYIKEYIA